MAGYTKLWSSIVHSTIWRADNETRLLWITMLALCDQHGEVMASIPGLADAARISLADCERGLEILAAPDPYSRTPDNEGRRIEAIRGGWAVLNHGLYRDLLSAENKRATEAERKRRYRNKTKDCPEMSHAVPQCPTGSRQAEAEAEAEEEEEDTKNTCLKPSAPGPSPVWLEVPCVGLSGKTWPMLCTKVEEWCAAFPGVNVESELRKAAQWLRDNPTKRKTASGLPAFFGRWLSKAQNSHHDPITPTNHKRTHEVDAALKPQLSSYQPLRVKPQ